MSMDSGRQTRISVSRVGPIPPGQAQGMGSRNEIQRPMQAPGGPATLHYPGQPGMVPLQWTAPMGPMASSYSPVFYTPPGYQMQPALGQSYGQGMPPAGGPVRMPYCAPAFGADWRRSTFRSACDEKGVPRWELAQEALGLGACCGSMRSQVSDGLDEINSSQIQMRVQMDENLDDGQKKLLLRYARRTPPCSGAWRSFAIVIPFVAMAPIGVGVITAASGGLIPCILGACACFGVGAGLGIGRCIHDARWQRETQQLEEKYARTRTPFV